VVSPSNHERVLRRARILLITIIGGDVEPQTVVLRRQ